MGTRWNLNPCITERLKMAEEHKIKHKVNTWNADNFNVMFAQEVCGRYSNSLRAGPSRDQISVGARFSTPIQTGPGVHPASYTMGSLSPKVKRLGRDAEHPLPSSAKVKERVELYIYYSFGPSWPVLGRTLPLSLLLQK